MDSICKGCFFISNAGAKPHARATFAHDNVDTQPIDVMSLEPTGKSPIPTSSPTQPTRALRKQYQGQSPPSVSPAACSTPKVPESASAMKDLATVKAVWCANLHVWHTPHRACTECFNPSTVLIAFAF